MCVHGWSRGARKEEEGFVATDILRCAFVVVLLGPCAECQSIKVRSNNRNEVEIGIGRSDRGQHRQTAGGLLAIFHIVRAYSSLSSPRLKGSAHAGSLDILPRGARHAAKKTCAIIRQFYGGQSKLWLSLSPPGGEKRENFFEETASSTLCYVGRGTSRVCVCRYYSPVELIPLGLILLSYTSGPSTMSRIFFSSCL